MRQKSRHVEWYVVSQNNAKTQTHVYKRVWNTEGEPTNEWVDSFAEGTPFTKTQAREIADGLSNTLGRHSYFAIPDRAEKQLETKIDRGVIRSVVETGDVKFDPDTCCPQHKMTIQINVSQDPQHDGHLWCEQDVESEENRLVEALAEAIKPHLRQAIREIDPFAIHY